MRSRFLLATALVLGLSLVGGAAPAPAGGKNNGPPIVFQLAPAEKLLADVRSMVKIVGGDAVVGMMDDAIKNKLGEKGWAGLDTKKPIAGYVILPNKALKGPEDYKDLSGVVAVPVTTENDFKEFFNRSEFANPVKFHPVKGNDGLFAVYPGDEEQADHPPVRCRFHNGYAYIGINAKDQQLDATALVPVADLVKADDPGLFLIRFLVDRYPEEALKQSTEQIDETIAKVKQGFPGGTGATLAPIVEGYTALMKRMAATMKDTQESGFRLAFDEKSAEVAFESYAVPKKNTAYAKELADTKPIPHRFAALVTDKTPAALLLQLPTGSVEFKDMVQKALDAGQKAKDDAPPPAQPIIEELLKGLGRTIKGDSIDFALAVNAGKDGHYTAVGGVSFEDATGLEKVLKEAYKDAPQPVKDMIKLDAEKIEGVNVHRITPPDADETTKNIFGSTDVLVAFGPKGVYAAMGSGASDALKAALTAKPTAAKVLDLVVNPKQLGDLVKTGNEGIGAIAKGILGTTDQRMSAFSISYEGGSSMKVRTALNLKIIPKAAMGAFTSLRQGAAPPAPAN